MKNIYIQALINQQREQNRFWIEVHKNGKRERKSRCDGGMVCREDCTVVGDSNSVRGGCQVKEECRLGLEKLNVAGN